MTSADPSNPAIPANTEVLMEAEALSAEILKDIEMSQARLSVVVLKALRLARILNDFDVQQVFEWESGGYPRGASGVSPEVWSAGTKANRIIFGTDSTPDVPETYMYMESIEQMERLHQRGGQEQPRHRHFARPAPGDGRQAAHRPGRRQPAVQRGRTLLRGRPLSR